MKTLILSGSLCRLGEDHFTEEITAELHARLQEDAVILLVSAAPDDFSFTKYVLESTVECFMNSGIPFSSITMLSRENCHETARLVSESDLVMLCGGHVPTQNVFLHETGLPDILRNYPGIVIGCSAGAMNCADMVYSHPELDGESTDLHYQRWLKGLGLTDINLVPHFQQTRNALLDGRRLFEDIIFPDSWRHPFYSIPDGTYIIVENGKPVLHGEAYIIQNSQIRKICDQEGTYTFMNFIFISPHFPKTYCHFCSRLKANGVNVLGIADTNFENLDPELKDSLTDYYKVDNLEDYQQVFKAVAFFSFKYGKIDWIESNNEYWLEQDARLRTDFNITSGLKSDKIGFIKNKSQMKVCYAKGNIPTARQIKASSGLDAVLEFTSRTGYPIIAKPDNGVGAEGTFKICSDDELKKFFDGHTNNYQYFVIEEFITGELVSYDAIYNSKAEPVFESMCHFPTPIMDIVNNNLDNCYYADKKVPEALSEIGRRTVKAFGVTGRFVHLEFFRLDRDREGLGKKGDYVGLEVNMRPAGGYTPDMMNFAHSTDVYQIWADMVAFDEARKGFGKQYYCAYASRRKSRSYVHSNSEIRDKYSQSLVMCEEMPEALSSALGDFVYMARFDTKKEIDEFFKFVKE